ncbi:MAG: TIGR02611 family protein [Streptosporangiales bacterium]|nr:TIGR02611 family protein [Streptosporangiales bacterium]
MTSEAPHRPVRGARRLRAWIRHHAVLNTTWRIAVFVVGVAVILGGLIMLVTPGPGWLAVIAGFGLLATEFGWARRALHKARDAGQAAKEKALDPRVRRRNQVLLAAACVVVLAALGTYFAVYGWTPPWHLRVWHRLP